MTFQKGQSGNPLGAALYGSFRTALAIALTDTDKRSRKTKLRLVAEALVKKAIKGDLVALKEVADRIDGKAIDRHADVTPPDPAREARADELRRDMIEMLDLMASAKSQGRSQVVIDIVPKKPPVAALPGKPHG